MSLGTPLHGRRSFLIQNALSPDKSRIAASIPHQLVFSEIHSADGIKVCLDKPLGSKKYKPNLSRPAVVRQFFGDRKQDVKILLWEWIWIIIGGNTPRPPFHKRHDHTDEGHWQRNHWNS